MRLSKKMIRYAKSKGVDEIQINFYYEESKEVNFENNKLKNLSIQDNNVYIVTVIIDKKSSEVIVMDISDYKAIVDNAILLAKVSKKDKYNSISGNIRKVVKVRRIKDKTEVSLSEILKTAVKFIDKILKQDSRVKIESAYIKNYNQVSSIINSKGVDRKFETSSSSYSITGLATENNNVSSLESEVIKVVFWKDLIECLKKGGKEFIDKSIRSLGAKSMPSGKMYVLLNPDSFAQIVQKLNKVINAKNVQDNISRFKGKLNKKVASELLTIIDKPHRNGSLLSKEFDWDGIPTQELLIIENGILKNYIYSNYAANKGNCRPTGHNGKLHAPEINGNMKLDEIMKLINKGILVERFAGTIDSISGVCSGVVKEGYYIKKGKKIHTVFDTMISADYFDIINNIVALSIEKKTTTIGQMPYALIKTMDVIGK